jgi:uncharacterized protein
MTDIIAQLAREIRVHERQVSATVELLDGGATVPFIARYRKEATGGLDDIQLRELAFRLDYLRDLNERRLVIRKSIEEQGKLTGPLLELLLAAQTKQELEDLYLPFKPRRRTKAQLAREAGIEPLANQLLDDPTQDPSARAVPFVAAQAGADGSDFTTVAAVLDGVRDILSERWAEDAQLVQGLREWLWSQGTLQSRLVSGKDPQQAEHAKFRDYFEYDEPLCRVPSHRALAVFRGRALELLDVKVLQPALPALTEQKSASHTGQLTLAEGRIAQHVAWQHQGRAADNLLHKCILWSWRVKLSLSIERDLFSRLREASEKVAIKVFAGNVRDLLLAAPAGARVVMGLDPGIRTGVKVAVVDVTGKLLDTATIFPHEPRRDWEGALAMLERLCQRHAVNLIAIGNGTASRQTDALAQELLVRLTRQRTAAGTSLAPVDKVVVSEAGASVYSASELASLEMPDVDVSLRGAASIARRLQDPLAELVKIDPKSIGVGQYQHDVNQSELARSLDSVVEDCVNAVGVDLNTASAPLLSRVSGLSGTVAKSLVRWREANGTFRSRRQLLEVQGLGKKTFEQCAGFLRIRGGENPLDASGVHPESYDVVQRILQHAGRRIEDFMGHAELVRSLRPEAFATESVGLLTVADILQELEKPGRDPRPDFRIARFSEGVHDLADLREGMILEGTVSNVAAFGAFVDLGVHQDGLVHVSELSEQFVVDARQAVKTGDVVKVRVVEVDMQRKRIALSMRLADMVSGKANGNTGRNRFEPAPRGPRDHAQRQPRHAAPSAMASAFARLQENKR